MSIPAEGAGQRISTVKRESLARAKSKYGHANYGFDRDKK